MQQVYSISPVLVSKTRREHRAYQYNSLSYTREKMKDIGAQNGGMNMLERSWGEDVAEIGNRGDGEGTFI